MRLSIRAALCSFALVALAVAPNTALAAQPDHNAVSGSFTDPDFCGTGEPIDIAFSGIFNYEPTADGWRFTSNEKVLFTNPANGMKVAQQVNGYEKVTVTQLDDGSVIFEHTMLGNPSTIKTYHGPVLVKDAGYVVIDDHFDANLNLLGTTFGVVVHGPHPADDSTLFCTVMTDALGL